MRSQRPLLIAEAFKSPASLTRRRQDVNFLGNGQSRSYHLHTRQSTFNAHRQPSCSRPSHPSLTARNTPLIPQHAFTRQYSDRIIKSILNQQHESAVARIAATVRDYYTRKEKFRIFHGSTNSTRSGVKRNLVDTSGLNHVLHVDTERKTCLVEPNVPMDRLVEATMKHGLVPPVVMEFPGITVGGGYSGTSGESSSFKHGFFDRTINWVEMVLADGEVLRLSRTENADLFHGAAGAVGTFGVTTLVELQLHDAKDYVETTYHPVSSMSEATTKLQAFTKDHSLDYIDGIMYSLTSGAIITGRMTDTPPSSQPIQRFSSPWDPWFYMHVQSKITQSPASPSHDTIPLAEYLFRYDRAGFWVGKSAFDYFKFPFNKFTRWWLDDFVHTRMMYTALHASGESKKYIVQDLALPYATAEQFVQYTDKEFNIYPLWLCPLKQSPLPTMHPHSAEYEASSATADGSDGDEEPVLKQMLNIGLWGPGPADHTKFISANRALERKLRSLGGMKWFYAHTYYSPGEFWEMFDKGWYDRLRRKYRAESLPSVYDKVSVDVEAEEAARKRRGWLLTVWPLAGFWGIWRAIRSRSYVQSRASVWKEFGRGREGKPGV